MEKHVDVIVPKGLKQQPKPHEIEVAWILAKHYKCKIEFIRPIEGYKIKNPDILIMGRIYEIKSPLGNSKKSTVKRQFEKATLQHAYGLVFDSRMTKLSESYLIASVRYELSLRSRIKKVVFITKRGKIIEIT